MAARQAHHQQSWRHKAPLLPQSRASEGARPPDMRRNCTLVCTVRSIGVRTCVCAVRMHHLGALACVADGPGPSEPQPLTIDTFLMTLTVDSFTHVNQVMRSLFSDIARIIIHTRGMPNIIWIADVRNNGGCAPYPASNEGSKAQHHQRSL